MAERKPLVILDGSVTEGGGEGAPLVVVDGMVGELPEGDTLFGSFGSNALNFIARVKAGIKFAARADLVAARTTIGIRISNIVASLRMQLRPAFRFVPIFSGVARVFAKPALKFSMVANGSNARPLAKPGLKIVHSFVHLVQDQGASSVVQEAVGGRSDWTNPANAQGRRNATLASIAGNALGARGGKLVGSYPAHFNKSALTITKVLLRFYIRQAGTLAANGTLTIGYRVSGGGDVPLTDYSGNVDFLNSPAEFDLTAVIGNDWAKLDTLKFYVSFNTAALNASSADVDAVERHVEANKTEIQ